MKPQDVALWIGLASSIGGVAVGYGTLNEKVAQLETSTDATHLEQRLTTLEVRINDNDIGHISTEIQELRGRITGNTDKVESLVIPNTSILETQIKVLETQIQTIKEELKEVDNRFKEIKNKPANPLL
tara:strand:- start:106 stop:489 length:384 start_codon:yes stop_codon:yes gene_type:complete